MLLSDDVLHLRGELALHVLERPCGVEQEYAAVLDALENVVARYIRGIVAGDELGLVYKVRGLYRRLAEAQMRNGETA